MNPDPNAPTPERRRRSAFAVGPAFATDDEPARAGTRVFRSVPVIDRQLRLGALNRRQHEAAEQLRNDYDLGVIGAREAASGSASTTGWYYPEARLAALRKYQDAAAALGPTRNCVERVVLDDTSVSELAKTEGRNRQEVAGILKLGLGALADHYGLP